MGHTVPALVIWLQVCRTVVCGAATNAPPAPLGDRDASLDAAAVVTNDSADTWLDRANDAVYRALEVNVERVDGLFAAEGEQVQRVRNSKLRVKLHTRIEERGGPDVSLEPDASVDLYLPHLSRRLNLALRSTDIDELPGVDPTEEDSSWLLGVVRTTGRKRAGDLTWGAGAKLKPAPEPYATIGARREFDGIPWYVTPAQKVFWSGDEGFGELTSLSVERLLGPRSGAVSTSAAKWTEETDGVEWEQSVLLAFFPRGYVRSRRNRQHTVGLKGSVFGHKSGSGVVDRYRVQLGWRRPLRRRWLYLDVVPGVDFDREKDWDELVWIRFGLEVFFDGSVRTEGKEAACTE
ncbi:MAG: hypothetical protein JXB13_08965 [Phycisphaerae bacterium]|nr:hypothetical protein [Phycisphaerae bacterium]